MVGASPQSRKGLFFGCGWCVFPVFEEYQQRSGREAVAS